MRPEQLRVDGSVGSVERTRVGEVSFYGHDAAVHIDLLPDGPSVVARLAGLDAPGVETRVRSGSRAAWWHSRHSLRPGYLR